MIKKQKKITEAEITKVLSFCDNLLATRCIYKIRN